MDLIVWSIRWVSGSVFNGLFLLAKRITWVSRMELWGMEGASGERLEALFLPSFIDVQLISTHGIDLSVCCAASMYTCAVKGFLQSS